MSRIFRTFFRATLQLIIELCPSPSPQARAGGKAGVQLANRLAGSIRSPSCSRSSSMFMYFRKPHFVPAVWRRRPAASVNALRASGRLPTTRVRRRISFRDPLQHEANERDGRDIGLQEYLGALLREGHLLHQAGRPSHRAAISSGHRQANSRGQARGRRGVALKCGGGTRRETVQRPPTNQAHARFSTAVGSSGYGATGLCDFGRGEGKNSCVISNHVTLSNVFDNLRACPCTQRSRLARYSNALES